jgi:hypothetical protein
MELVFWSQFFRFIERDGMDVYGGFSNWGIPQTMVFNTKRV